MRRPVRVGRGQNFDCGINTCTQLEFLCSQREQRTGPANPDWISSSSCCEKSHRKCWRRHSAHVFPCRLEGPCFCNLLAPSPSLNCVWFLSSLPLYDGSDSVGTAVTGALFNKDKDGNRPFISAQFSCFSSLFSSCTTTL